MPATSPAHALYALKPADRVDLTLNAHDGPKKQGEALYAAFKSDLFLVRVGQIAWSHYRDKLNGKGDENTAALHHVITKILNDTGLREVLVNTVVQLYEKSYSSSQASAHCVVPVSSRRSRDESIDCIKQVRIEWEQGINEELMAIAQEMARPFTMARAKGVFSRIISGDPMTGTARRDSVRFLFDSEDLLETGTLHTAATYMPRTRHSRSNLSPRSYPDPVPLPLPRPHSTPHHHRHRYRYSLQQCQIGVRYPPSGHDQAAAAHLSAT